MNNENNSKKPVTAAVLTDAEATPKKAAKVIEISKEETDDNIVTLSQPYSFEGEEIEKLDLRGVTDLSGKQLQKIEKLYRKITENVSASPETTIDYAVATAHVLTGYPAEFLLQMSGKDLVKIKTRVIAFLYGDED